MVEKPLSRYLHQLGLTQELGFSLALTALATGVVALLRSALPGHHEFLFIYMGSIVAVAYAAGRVAGVAAALLSTASGALVVIMPAAGDLLTAGSLIVMSAFAVVAVGVALTASRLRDRELERAGLYQSDRAARRSAEDALRERDKSMRALRESEARYRRLVETSPDAIALTDLRMRILLCNRQATALFRAGEARDVTGRSLLEFVVPEDRDRALTCAEQAQTGGVTDLELTMLRAGGIPFPGELSISAILEPEGQLSAYITVMRDVTERRQAEQVRSLLVEASAMLTASIDFDSRLQTLARLAVPALADWCLVDVVEDGGARRVAVAHADPARAALAEQVRLAALKSDSDVGVPWVLRTGQPELIPEVTEAVLAARAQDRQQVEVMRTLGVRSLMTVPLAARNRTLGGMTFIFAESDRRYGRADLAVAEELARRAALAVDNARLYRDAQDAVERMEESFALLDTLLASAPVGLAFLDRELRYVRINEALAGINGLAAAAHVGKTVREIVPGMGATLEPMLQRALEGEQLSTEVNGETPAAPGRTRHWIVSCFPVRVRGQHLLGVGVAVQEITQQKRVEEEQRLLAQAGAVLATSLDYEKTLEKVAQLAVPLLGEWCLVDVVDVDGSHRRIAAAHAHPGDGRIARRLEQCRPPDLSGIDSRPQVYVAGSGSAANRHTLIALAHGDETSAALLEEIGVASAMVVPMPASGHTEGAFTFLSVDPSRRYEAADQALAQLLARRAGYAIETARLYEREHHIAETLQRGLLPERLPEIPGVWVAVRYLPARGVEVGGDWYDVLQFPDGLVGLVMGDVAGRGAHAAAVMGQLRSAFRAYALEDPAPVAVAERLNRLVVQMEPREMATLLYMLVDPSAQTVWYVNAGHTPPLVRTPGGTAIYLQTDHSVPLGAVADWRYHEASATIEAGSTLLLFTDGLIEYHATIPEGLERLAQVVAHGPDEPESLCHHVLGTILTGKPIGDDVALLAVQAALMRADGMHLQLPAVPESLRRLRHTLKRWLREVGATPSETFQIIVASSEAASNAVEHAYGPGDAVFDVDVALEDGEVAVTIRDFGGWREPRGSLRGRGRPLMEGLMDTVTITPGSEGTTVHLRRKLRQVARA